MYIIKIRVIIISTSMFFSKVTTMSNKMGVLSKQTLYNKDYSLPIDVVCNSCPELSQYLQRRTLKVDLSDPNALKVYNQCLFWILEG